jgi:hypothetical protein
MFSAYVHNYISIKYPLRKGSGRQGSQRSRL